MVKSLYSYGLILILRLATFLWRKKEVKDVSKSNKT